MDCVKHTLVVFIKQEQSQIKDNKTTFDKDCKSDNLSSGNK